MTEDKLIAWANKEHSEIAIKLYTEAYVSLDGNILYQKAMLKPPDGIAYVEWGNLLIDWALAICGSPLYCLDLLKMESLGVFQNEEAMNFLGLFILWMTGE